VLVIRPAVGLIVLPEKTDGFGELKYSSIIVNMRIVLPSCVIHAGLPGDQ
jgi:hypothetical protein